MSAKQYVDLPGITVYDEEIKEYIEEKAVDLTYAEYQALPSSKESDNVSYHITDVEPTSADINDSITSQTTVWSSSKITQEITNVTIGWSNPVYCVTGDTTCTIEDERITTSSAIELFKDIDTAPVIITSKTVSDGEVVLTFEELAEPTVFQIRITNRFDFPGGETDGTITLTQAEYNELLAQGKIDPTKKYWITDGILNAAPVVDSIITNNKTWSSAKIHEEDLEKYSTDEIVIGTWIDDKPIYRKVITFVMPSTGSDYYFAHDISNIAQVVGYEGYTSPNTSDNNNMRPLNFCYFGDSNWDSAITVGSTNCLIQMGSSFRDAYAGKTCYVILKYTKTTD